MTVSNDGGEKRIASLLPLLYTFLRGIEASRNADQEYQAFQSQGISDSNGEMTTQFVRTAVGEIARRYNLTEDRLLEVLPPKYRGFGRALYSMQWGNAVEVVANVIKEYGKDRETDEYRTTREVLGNAVKQLIGNRILDQIIQ